MWSVNIWLILSVSSICFASIEEKIHPCCRVFTQKAPKAIDLCITKIEWKIEISRRRVGSNTVVADPIYIHPNIAYQIIQQCLDLANANTLGEVQSMAFGAVNKESREFVPLVTEILGKELLFSAFENGEIKTNPDTALFFQLMKLIKAINPNLKHYSPYIGTKLYNDEKEIDGAPLEPKEELDYTEEDVGGVKMCAVQ